jgi:hypothetical protein
LAHIGRKGFGEELPRLRFRGGLGELLGLLELGSQLLVLLGLRGNGGWNTGLAIGVAA